MTGQNLLLLGQYVWPITITSISLIIVAILSYSVSDFGTIDISGKNFIAYKYKAFLNNLADNKLLQIFN